MRTHKYITSFVFWNSAVSSSFTSLAAVFAQAPSYLLRPRVQVCPCRQRPHTMSFSMRRIWSKPCIGRANTAYGSQWRRPSPTPPGGIQIYGTYTFLKMRWYTMYYLSGISRMDTIPFVLADSATYGIISATGRGKLNIYNIKSI